MLCTNSLILDFSRMNSYIVGSFDKAKEALKDVFSVFDRSYNHF